MKRRLNRPEWIVEAIAAAVQPALPGFQAPHPEPTILRIMMKPAKHKFALLKQVIEIIPPYRVGKIARQCGVDKKVRSYSAWSHVVAMIFAHLSHALSLNDICDTLLHHSGALSTLRNAEPPSRNGLSHANKVRSSEMARELFYQTLDHLTGNFPRFGRFDGQFKISRRIKRVINLVDSTTIQLFANCMDWAKHRRRKAAAKCHMLLDARTFLPRFAIVKSAKSHDAVKGRILCNQLQDGEIVIFDMAYVDFKHLFELMSRGILWVTRAKTNVYAAATVVFTAFCEVIYGTTGGRTKKQCQVKMCVLILIGM